jgi:hypothetical protein
MSTVFLFGTTPMHKTAKWLTKGTAEFGTTPRGSFQTSKSVPQDATMGPLLCSHFGKKYIFSHGQSAQPD